MHEIVSTMAQSTAAVDEGRDAIDQAAGAMHSVADRVTNVAVKMRDISGILQQQKEASSEIAQSVSHVASIAGENRLVLDEMNNKLKATNGRFVDFAKELFDANSHGSVCQIAKIDHIMFVQRIIETVIGAGNWKALEVPDHHNCRLGKWYDALPGGEAQRLPSYGELASRLMAASMHMASRRSSRMKRERKRRPSTQSKSWFWRAAKSSPCWTVSERKERRPSLQPTKRSMEQPALPRGPRHESMCAAVKKH